MDEKEKINDTNKINMSKNIKKYYDNFYLEIIKKFPEIEELVEQKIKIVDLSSIKIDYDRMLISLNNSSEEILPILINIKIEYYYKKENVYNISVTLKSKWFEL